LEGYPGRSPGLLRLTLEEAQTRALEASHRLAEARSREAAAQAVIAAREAASRPVLSALAGYTRTNHVPEFIFAGPTGAPRVLYPDVPDNYRTRLDLQWLAYTGGRPNALERAARAEAAAAGADVAIAHADLRLEVARAYWTLVAARAAVGVLDQGVTRAQVHLNDARQRLNAGLVPPNEVSSAEAQQSRQRMLLIEAQNQVALVAADLSRLIGVEPQPLEPAAALEQTASAAIFDTTALAVEARGKRGERLALERRIEVAEEQRRAAAAGMRPTVALAGGVDYARPNPRIFPRAGRWDDSWDAGINVTWPLWDGGRTQAEVAQTGNLAAAARQRLAEFDSVLTLEIRQRVLDLDSGRAALSAAADAVRAAADARRVVSERYRAGVGTYSEVLDAESALLQAELDRTRALTGLRISEARLERALGR
jgi:outer membrane protein TolC